ncbi:hypothetical protein ACLGIH_33015 [Streptomyces sp. HMX87]|uniref:hypothetical protein n=1 Tax=Streptomyces sp. HMX87 TaxID=3390849 RepID=UPI003A8B7857
MLLLAVLVLPALSLLLLVMSRIEDRLLEDARSAHHARHARRRLRLVTGGKSADSGTAPSHQRSLPRRNAA